MTFQFPGIESSELAKEMIWLAWQAADRPLGMGVLQDRPGATRDEVWHAAWHRTDYPGGFDAAKPGLCEADYVFGRMLKLYLTWNENGVSVPGSETRLPHPEYQSWCKVYPSYAALAIAAGQSLLATQRPPTEDE